MVHTQMSPLQMQPQMPWMTVLGLVMGRVMHNLPNQSSKHRNSWNGFL